MSIWVNPFNHVQEVATQLVGRTICAAEAVPNRLRMEARALVFTLDDGRTFRLTPTGYDAEGVEIEENPHRHDHNPLNADFHGGVCAACEWANCR